MTMNGTATETIKGRVVGANSKGIKVGGSDAWLNYSRFAEVPHPANGQMVRVDVGGDGFIRKLAILDGAESSALSSGSASAPLDGLTLRLRVLEIAANTGWPVRPGARAGQDGRRLPARRPDAGLGPRRRTTACDPSLNKWRSVGC